MLVLLMKITEVMQRVNIQVRRTGDILRYAKDFTRKDQNLERHAQDINLIVQDTLSLLETLEHFKEIEVNYRIRSQSEFG